MKIKITEINTVPKRQDFFWYVKEQAILAESFFSTLIEQLNHMSFPETHIELLDEKIKKDTRKVLHIESEGFSSSAKILLSVVGQDLHVMLIVISTPPHLNLFQYEDNVAFMVACVELITNLLGTRPWTR